MHTNSTQAALFPQNVVDGVGTALDAHGENVFLQRFFCALKIEMGETFEDYTFVVHRRTAGEHAGNPINLLPGASKKVLIVISDETEVFPCEEFLSYDHIFRSYGNPTSGESRIHPFPVGYMNAAGLADFLPFEARDTPVFFSGYLNRNRVDLLKQFRPIFWLPKKNLPNNKYVRELARRAVEKLIPERMFDGWFPSAKIGFTEWFAKGLPPEEYARVLANTKIAICPPGFISHETIRHWEAMRLGCVIISAPLPPNRFYAGSPIIQLEDWSNLKSVVSHLLHHPNELLSRHHQTLAWWENHCSESALATYMADILR